VVWQNSRGRCLEPRDNSPTVVSCGLLWLSEMQAVRLVQGWRNVWCLIVGEVRGRVPLLV
jgi:hypothetical protein